MGVMGRMHRWECKCRWDDNEWVEITDKVLKVSVVVNDEESNLCYDQSILKN